MRLDTSTERGRRAKDEEGKAIAMFLTHHPALDAEETEDHSPVRWDYWITKRGEKVALVEVKAREESFDTFMRKFNGEWLVTWDKVMECIAKASQSNVPFVGFLWCVHSQTLIFETIWRPTSDQILVPYRAAETVTQATVNGGKALRLNGFLDMKGGTVLR